MYLFVQSPVEDTFHIRSYHPVPFYATGMSSYSRKSPRTSPPTGNGHDTRPQRHVQMRPTSGNDTPTSTHRGVLSDLAASTELPSFPILQPPVEEEEDEEDVDIGPWPCAVDPLPTQRVIHPFAHNTSPHVPLTSIQGEHVTYHTNDLGLFQGPTDNPVFTSAPPKLTNLFPSLDPEPRRALEGYEHVGGWTTDEAGRPMYVPTGHIQEIPDETDSSDIEFNGHVGPYSSSSSSSSSHAMLPIETTPPPTPQPFKPRVEPPSVAFLVIHLPSSIASSELDEEDLESELPTLSPLSTVEHDISGFSSFLREEPVVNQCLNKIRSLCDSFSFLAPSRQDDNGLCNRIIESLSRVRNSVYRGLYVPNEKWNFLSGPKRLGFRNRLLSLHRTLSRLERVSTHYTLLQPKRLNYITTKLTEHHRKLADIAFKFDATFDFLEVCDLHAKASQGGNSPDDESTTLYLNARASYLRRHSRPSHRASEH
ncbi:hypothetical protein VNI00_004190 [Paramarasmius palmivorus]|uniref:Uncharacterized protein n=1 Tax=Paramarasmius palmivorus TaxID=297713 RepID=A0AAW0DK46_9AGAR